MRTVSFDTEESWLDARRGRVTGTRLKDLVGRDGFKPKAGFYELIAERVAVPATEEPAMDRGRRLESVAIAEFAKRARKKVNPALVLWHREDDPNIAVSPDGTIGKMEAVEVKCLSSSRHIEAWLTRKVPADYELQVLQYFIVNDALKRLYLVFYDPRMPKDLFWVTVDRKEVAGEVAKYLALEREALAKAAEIERQLTF